MLLLGGNRPKYAKKQDGKYIGSIPEDARKMIDDIYLSGRVKALKNILNGYELSDFQTVHASIAYLSKKFLVGADTGLGKSLIISAYLKIHEMKGTLGKDNKCLIVTTTSSLEQIKTVIEESTGLTLKHIPGDSTKLLKELEKGELDNYNVYIVTHSVFSQSIDFNWLYAYISSKVTTMIVDESMGVANPDSFSHMSVKQWIKNVDFRLFLNGTIIEKSLEQPYYQLSLLDEDLFPDYDTLKKPYELWSKKDGKSKHSKLVGYKDLDKLLNSIPYHFLNTSRKELGLTFETNDILIPLQATPLQKSIETPKNYLWCLYSPSTNIETKSIPFDRENVPALDATVQLVKQQFIEKGGGIVIYAEPVDCKEVLKREILNEVPQARIGIIDGNSDKELSRIPFNEGRLDILIINIPEALDLVSGRIMIFYTIPSKHYQAKARILRGISSDTDVRTYYYPIYLNSGMSNYVQTTLKRDEITLTGSLDRDITTARKLAKELEKMEKSTYPKIQI